uniref:Phosphoinositide phospholipase C n=1 Tax=Poecilia formosa TaxID=48698 RepID=A0A087XWQ2_POEFO
MAELEVCRNLSLERVERCMSVMQSGTQMVKLKAGSKGLVRLFYLDEHRSCIRWKPSRKSEKAKITIDSLYKVTEGGQSDIFHRHADGNFDQACCFTVYHGNHMESLDLVTSNAEEARTWITGLRYLMAGISDEDSLAKRQRTHDQYPSWMKQTFEEADKNGDGLLNIDEIYQLLHKLNVNLPRRKVKQMFQEADTDDHQGTLTYEEFSVFYKMMSLRRDLFLLMMAYSDRKDHLTVEELANFLHNEQKMTNVTPEYVAEIIDKFEVSDENKQRGVLGIEGFTSFMRSPTCDIFNPLHHEVNQDMEQPLCNYFIASSHNTYLTGDQLLSHSKTDMYAWVLQSGCRCVEVDCWDGPDGEPMVQHGYTLTSKITFKSVIETINKYAFINNQYPVILSIENHCSIQQQKKIAEYLREIFADKLDVGEVLSRDSKTLPSPHSLQGKILIKGKRLPAYLSADAEEGEVSDDDSADEIEEDFKLKSSNGNGNHQVESHIRKKLDSLLKESRIVDKEDTDSFSIRALLRATHQGLQKNLRQSSKGVLKKSQSRSLITTLKQKHFQRHSKSRLACQSVEKEEEVQERSGREAGGQFNRGGRKRKTMKLSRDLSNLVVFTNSVASQECLNEGTPGDVLSFSETRAQSLVNHRTEQFLAFNQRQLSRIYPSAYRIDSSNFNPQFYWNVGCQLVVALNYQTDGRMMQLNRSKFMVNGGIGYVLKPPPMCKGSFNPFSDDPLPAYPKKQLVLKIISGQHLPKPPDSMLGDRGEIIDPFVEVEIIGLPIDCCKEQTRVVDDNGFNPVWEETLSFTLHMAELALVRFLVWDHDPIGRDFIGQRTVAFSSLMPGYRHVYLEGLTEASIFVHVSVHDVYGKWSPLVLNPSFTIMHFLGTSKGHQLRGIRGFFNRSSKSSVDTNTSGLRKRSISDHLLRRTASAPAKGRKKTKMALSESVASISDHRNGTDAGASGGEWLSARAEGPAKPLQPRAPLVHRPISMPLDRLLQGQLSICSPDKEQHDVGADTIIGEYFCSNPIFIPIMLSLCPLVHKQFWSYKTALNAKRASRFDRPRSSSADAFFDQSFSVKSLVSTPPKTNRKKERDQPEETSYLVIGGGGIRKEEVYVNYKSEQSKSNNFPKETDKAASMSPLTNSQTTSDKPETSSNSTTFTLAPSSSSSSSSAPSFLPVVSATSFAPSSLHDSTLSRLIDGVSIGIEQDTCCSVSALIDQFECTGDLKNLTTPSQTVTSSHLNFRATSPNFRKDLKSPLINKMTSPKNKPMTNSQKSSYVHSSICSPNKNKDKLAAALISSPETAELEEVYTILDEEVLSPVSVYNLRKQTVHVQADTTGSTPCSSLGSSPVKTIQNLGKGSSGERMWDERQEVAEPEILHHSAGESFTEVELNVDEDPSQIIPNQSKQWASSQFSFPMNKQCRQNSYPIPKGNSDLLNNSQTSDLRSCCSTLLFNGSHQQRPENNQIKIERGGFYNGFSSAESLLRQCSASQNRSRQRALCSPSSESYLQSSLSVTDSTPRKPCKSKSLGDLTSEDISCNFQSKYNIISRSFITPHITRPKPIDTTGKHSFRTKSNDPLTEQLRRLVSLDQEPSVSPIVSRDTDDSPPPMLARRLSSRSQSRVRHINSRARERQQEALKARPGVAISNGDSLGGVVWRNKPSLQNQPPNRHSTGSYIAGYLDELEDRGLPEGACTSVRYGNVDHFRDDSLPLGITSHSDSEPEVYFLLRL